MPKIAVLAYHKNAQKIYKRSWISQYRQSVLNQTYKDFDIFEINYGEEQYYVFEDSLFYSLKYNNFVEALNFLLDECFYNRNYDYVFNTNVDDWFSLDRIEKQLPYLEQGYDIVSSNFSLIRDDSIYLEHKFENLNIKEELDKNHNVVAHPVVGYSRHFWMNNRYIPEEQPLEDLKLWQRAIDNHKFIILKDNLLFHRVHQNSVCQSENK